MNEKMNAIVGLVIAVLLVGAVGATIVMFMAEADAYPCKSLGSFYHNKSCPGYVPK